jgi:uncharacterized membrane protein YgcG
MTYMRHGPIIVISLIIVGLIAALIIAYYHSASTKAIAEQCDKTKKVCQIQSETTYFGGYFPVYSYYYIPYAFLYGPGLGSSYYYPGPTTINNPSVCNNCLTRITPQDEQDILNSKSPVSQSDLPSEQPSPVSSSSMQSESNNPNPSESANPSEQSSPPPSSPENNPSSESSSSSGSEGVGSGGDTSGSTAGGDTGGGGGGE